MKQDEIIRMARKLATRHGSRMCDEDGETHGEELYCVDVDDIAEIIKQVAAHEREACAKVCEIAWKNGAYCAEQAEQEPVAWAYIDADGSFMDALDRQHGAYQTPLYTAPVRTKDLTDEEIWKANKTELPDCQDLVDFARAVIAADREKNRGTA